MKFINPSDYAKISKKKHENILRMSKAESRSKYTSAEPSFSTTRYDIISDFYGSQECMRRFIPILKEKLKRRIGEENAIEVLKLISSGKLIIPNDFVFLCSKKRQVQEDIGTRAFNLCEGDSAKFISLVSMFIQEDLRLGKKCIDLSSVFLYLANFRGILKEEDALTYKTKTDEMLRFLAGLTTVKNSNPFVVHVLTTRLIGEISRNFGLTYTRGYNKLMGDYVEALYSLKELMGSIAETPKFFVTRPMYENARENQISYFASLFGLKPAKATNMLKGIKDLGERSPELVSIINQEKTRTKKYYFNPYKIIQKMKSVGESYEIITKTGEERETVPFLRSTIMNLDHFKKMDNEYIFPFKSNYIECFGTDQFSVEINAEKIETFEDIQPLISGAKDLLLVQYDHKTQVAPHARTALEKYIFKIKINNLKVIDKDFIQQLKDFEAELCSTYNLNIKFDIYFHKDAAFTPYGNPIPKYVRVISDIHADVNADYCYAFDFGNDFVINAGDTSGDFFTTKDWTSFYTPMGVGVTGNHLGYTDLGERAFVQSRRDSNFAFNIKSKNNQQIALLKFFEQTSFRFLSNTSAIFNDVLFIGTTLYTDFQLFGKEHELACIRQAEKYMNDFRYCYYTKRVGKNKAEIVPFTAEIHKDLFKVCVGFLRNELKRYERAKLKIPVVIVTHHAPTPYSIAPRYQADLLSASFASDLRWLIDEHPEIRMWVHGHVHDSFDYLYKNCRIVCEPFGYPHENRQHKEYSEDVRAYGKRISFNDIKSKRKWKDLLKADIRSGFIKQYLD